MGITQDQIVRGALQRLRSHYDAMVQLDEAPRSHQEFDMHAWSFARTAISSPDILDLLRGLVFAFDNAVLEEQDDAVEALELLVRGYVLLDNRGMDGHDQCSDLNGSLDAIEMLDAWGKEHNLQNALMYVDNEAYKAWGGEEIDTGSWLGFPNHVDMLVPRRGVEEALRFVRQTGPDPSDR